MGLLRGHALTWATAISDRQLEVWKVFDHPIKGKEATKHLLSRRQGPHSVAEYSVEFCVLATESGWNEEVLQRVFLNVLSKQLKDEFNMLISFIIHLDNGRVVPRESLSPVLEPLPVPLFPISSSLFSQGLAHPGQV